MITLKESILADNGIKESILSDMEDTLSVSDDKLYKKLYPVPKMRDFYKPLSYNKDLIYLNWECPFLIKDFAKVVEARMQKSYLSSGYKAEDIVGIEFTLHKAYDAPGYVVFNLYLCDTFADGKNEYHIYGVGSEEEKCTIPEAKKLIIEFIKRVCDNPKLLNKLALLHNTGDGFNNEHFKRFVNTL
jgi:hypothetical protein